MWCSRRICGARFLARRSPGGSAEFTAFEAQSGLVPYVYPSLSELFFVPVESPAVVSDTPDADLGKVGAKGQVLDTVCPASLSVLLPPVLAEERLSHSGKAYLCPSPHFSSTKNILEDLEV